MSRYQSSRCARLTLTLASSLFFCGQSLPAQPSQKASGCTSASDARKLLSEALKALGGESKLRAIETVQLDLTASRQYVEESERPEGPFIQDLQHVTEIHDFKNGRMRREDKVEIPYFPVEPFTTTWVADRDTAISIRGGKPSPGSATLVAEAADRLALSPEHVLLSALDSDKLACDGDTVLGSVPHNVIKFPLQGFPARVFINANTKLPGMVESSGPLARGGFWRYLGDIDMKVRWTSWSMQKGGVHYPLQWNVERNGLPDEVFFVHQVVFNPALESGLLSIPDDVRAQFKKNPPNSDVEEVALGGPNQAPEVDAPGIITIPGAWNVTFVDQGDGVVILEAPISSGFSAKVMDEAGRRFPGKPVKAVITTSDAWPHVAGIREYVARGIPIYALDLNRTIINRILSESRTVKPDALARNPRKPVIHWISNKTTIGAGANRLEIYPLRGATTERQMMVYFPEPQLLYASDAFQWQGDGTLWLPQTVSEVLDGVRKNNLTVNKYFMMHVELRDWPALQSEFQKEIAQ